VLYGIGTAQIYGRRHFALAGRTVLGFQSCAPRCSNTKVTLDQPADEAAPRLTVLESEEIEGMHILRIQKDVNGQSAIRMPTGLLVMVIDMAPRHLQAPFAPSIPVLGDGPPCG
jgi:hypothetical protein